MTLDIKKLLVHILGVDFRYPVGSYYETSLPSAIPSGNQTPISSDLSTLGNTWFDPNYAWGGTWVLETEGQVHVSAGTNYTIAGALTNTSDDGEATHLLTSSEIPAHTHGQKSLTGSFEIRRGGSSGNYDVAVSSAGIFSTTVTGGSTVSNALTFHTASHKRDKININATHTHDSYGGSGSHNNMQPYIVVNRWHRTA